MQNLLPQIRRTLLRSAITIQAKSAATKLQATIDVGTVVNAWEHKLKKAGILETTFNLKCLVAHVLRMDLNALPNYESMHFTSAQLEEFQRLCVARCAHMPLQYILGHYDCMHEKCTHTEIKALKLCNRTEEFVQKIIQEYKDSPSFKLLEVCCGTAAMSLALLKALPQAHCTGIDRSFLITAMYRETAEMCGLKGRFLVYNHKMRKNKLLPTELVNCVYDLIISKPPFLKSSAFQNIDTEGILFEDFNVLDGGDDGLRITCLIFDLACNNLRTGGHLFLQLGGDHPRTVQSIIKSKYDGRLRCITGCDNKTKFHSFVKFEKI